MRLTRIIPLWLLLCPVLTSVAQTNPDLRPVALNFKYGYINNRGRIVVRPRYDSAREFAEGLARVEINGRFGFIDTRGGLAIKLRFNMASDFSDGLARVKIPDGKCDLCGEWVIWKPRI